MSSRRAQSLPPHSAESTKPERGRCVTAICFSWKVITCVVSHVTLVLLVVSYCVGGAYLFQHLEKPHEIEVKRAIHYIRLNLTDKIWSISVNVSVLKEDSWISDVKKDLATFEKDILTAIKSDGWDGDEDITKSQWTFAGSLFYSIIVITTIGYGHISPRTDGGKMTTIGYAIVGIPLMLLCLSNIGDVMATSFRFIYWRVCCYTCTRPSKPIRSRSRQHSLRGQRHNPLRMQPPPYRRSMKLMQPHQVHGSTMMMSSYSDPELLTVEPDRHLHLHRQERLEKQRHHQHHASAHAMSMNTSSRNFHPYDKTETIPNDSPLYGQSRSPRFNNRAKKRDRLEHRHTIERERHFNRSRKHFDSVEDLEQLASRAKRTSSVRSVRSTNVRREKMAKESREMRELNRLNTQPRGRSLLTQPKPKAKATKARAKSVDPRILHNYFDKEDEVIRKTSIITNRYAVEGMKEEKHQKRSQSMPRPNYYQNESARSSYAQKSCYSDAQPIYCTTPRYGNYLELPEFKIERSLPRDQRASSYYTTEYDEAGRGGSYYPENDYNYMERRDRKMHHHHNHGNYLPPTDAAAKSLPTHNRERILKGGKNEPLPPSPRIMSPMGFAVNRQIRPRINYDYEEDSWYSDEWNDFHNGDVTFSKDRPVPIWLCVFLVISYILGGAALFAYWEEWSFLDSAYFCFITLTTIGFGDFVPAKGVKDESEQSIAYCSLYLLFGIALLAMSFNLVQEEVIAKVKKVARRLGILKDGDDEYE